MLIKTRTFKCIYTKCYNSLIFGPDISKKIQKGHNFWQFKDHNSGRRHENQTNDPITQEGDMKTRQMTSFFSSIVRALTL